MKKFTLTEETPVVETKRMRVVRVKYVEGDGGVELKHMIVRSKPSIAVIVRKEGKIALIRQFRSTTGEYYYEIPAGVIEDGETAEQAAIREVREETGLLVSSVDVFVKGPSLLDPSKSDENYGVALADAFGEKNQALDADEQIDADVLWVPEETLLACVREQMFAGERLFGELYMSGHSLYALTAYMVRKQFY